MEHKQSSEAKEKGATHATTVAASSETASSMMIRLDVNCTSIEDMQSSSSESPDSKKMKHASDSNSSATLASSLPSSSTSVAATVVPFSIRLEIDSSGRISSINAETKENSTDDCNSSSTDASSNDCYNRRLIQSVSDCSSSSFIRANQSAESTAELCYRAFVHVELFFAPLANFHREAAAPLEIQLVRMEESNDRAQQQLEQLDLPLQIDL